MAEPAPREWMDGASVRAFVALDLSLDVVRRMTEAQQQMRRAAETAGWKVAWVQPTQFHLTLKFLGNVRAQMTGLIADRLATLAVDRRAFDVEAVGAGAFPDAIGPRVLWIGIREGSASSDSGGPIARLTADIEQSMEDLGFAREKRAFHAHVTVGRVKESTPNAGVLEPFANLSFGTCRVRDLVLYQSVLRSGGSEYRPLARIPFAQSSSPGRTATPAARAPSRDAENVSKETTHE